MPFDLSSAVPVEADAAAGAMPAAGAPPIANAAVAPAMAAAQPTPAAQPEFDLASAVPVQGAQQGAGQAQPSPGWLERLRLPESDPNSVENSVRRFFGAPAVGADQEFEKVANADSPFPDVMPTSPTLLRDLGSAVAAPVKYLLRGSDANAPAVQKAIDAFKEAGTSPSVGQATGNRLAQATESILGKYPGGAGVMAKKAENQASEIGSKVEELADKLSTNATPSVAGRTIEKGLSGPGGFLDRFKAGQKVLYDKLDPFFRYSEGSSKSVKLPNTMKALDMLNPSIPGAPATSKFFQNAEMERIKDAVVSDVNSMEAFGQRPNIAASNAMVKKAFRPADLQAMFEAYGGDNLPYEAVKKMRSLVGEKLDDFSLASTVPRSKWKSLYAALSDDLENAAKNTGDPAAIKAMQRANSFTRAGYARIDDILDKVGKGVPEKIFTSAVNPADMQAGATKIQGIMKSLTSGERDVVKSAFIRRMGTAAPGAQNAEGGIFSSQTFLTNWNRMSSQAKDIMFSSADGNLRKSLDSIAQTADRIKQGGKVLANPSGTGPVVAATGLISSVGTALGTGNYGVAAGLLTSAAGANLTSKLMTNPRFVGWLARASKIQNPELARQAVLSLGKTMQGEPSDIQQDAENYASAAAQSFQPKGTEQ